MTVLEVASVHPPLCIPHHALCLEAVSTHLHAYQHSDSFCKMELPRNPKAHAAPTCKHARDAPSSLQACVQIEQARMVPAVVAKHLSRGGRALLCCPIRDDKLWEALCKAVTETRLLMQVCLPWAWWGLACFVAQCRL